ncbi:hypothetical protein IscW_ISCW014953, partial [Ixodes scapularis]
AKEPPDDGWKTNTPTINVAHSTMARALLISTIAATALLLPWCRGASPPYPELNPALSKYQDATKCLPITEKWYIVYRNYESDPLFGGKAQCGKFSSLGPEEDGGFAMKLQFKHWSMTRSEDCRPLRSDTTMARMGFFGLMAAIVLLSPLCNGSGPPYPELNPALGKYQNALMATFHLRYLLLDDYLLEAAFIVD